MKAVRQTKAEKRKILVIALQQISGALLRAGLGKMTYGGMARRLIP